MSKAWFRWRRIALVVLTLGVGAAIGLYYYADRIVEQRLRPATIELLEERFNSKVELASMSVTLTPQLSVRAEGISVRHRGRTDVPPLITMRAFTIRGGLWDLWSRRVERIHVEGLEFVIPPRRDSLAPDPETPGDEDDDDEDEDVYIGELIAEASLLSIMSKREGKGPRVFQIRRLRFVDFHLANAIPFEAAITNPTPHGEIEAYGTFGPWASDEPSMTPVAGTFVFDADLGTIKGIGGALHAEGDFSGPLELIRTSGRTRTEGFHLTAGGVKFPLVVNYDAVVDGTNGDTILEKVEGMLGPSRISARGAIIKEGTGRRITLDTTTRDGRLEDFVRLTTRVESSPLIGSINVNAKIDIPPGDREVIEKIDIRGTFSVARARFTSQTIQNRVDELARRGQGRPKDGEIDDVASNFRGSFRLNDAKLHLSPLTFSVEGANVRLAGNYDTGSEVLDFKGELRLQARASQTQTGWKRLVLKIFDPMLDGPGAGTVLPISITGTRDQPKFGADIKKAILK
jgi:hypothetical protein